MIIESSYDVDADATLATRIRNYFVWPDLQRVCTFIFRPGIFALSAEYLLDVIDGLLLAHAFYCLLARRNNGNLNRLNAVIIIIISLRMPRSTKVCDEHLVWVNKYGLSTKIIRTWKLMIIARWSDDECRLRKKIFFFINSYNSY